MHPKIPNFFKIYQQLIAISSISSLDNKIDQSNLNLINLLMDYFNQLGFTVEVKQVPNTRSKFNMLACSGTGTGGLLLAGHTDTVPYDEECWKYDPFILTENNNKLYGLGAADMKGFFAFILDAIRDIEIKKFNKPLYILATADEEITMAGARYFANNTELCPNCAIIGEPTSLKPVRMHKGYISNIIRIHGQSGHSSCPEEGINAIELMHQSITQLIQLSNMLKANYKHDDFAIPYPTMNFGKIHGGDAVNKICPYCELHIDIRPLPGLKLSEFNNLLNEALAPIQSRWPGRLTINELYEPIPSYECQTNQELVQIIEKMLGITSEAVNYCTEAPFIQKLCPTLILGPGSIDQAHQPNEFLETKFIKPTILLLKKIISHFCCKEK